MRQKFLISTSIAVIGIIVILGIRQFTQAQDDGFTYAGIEPAPNFPEGLDWLNVSEPLTMSDLEGKIVLLDFWTYGCINCIHVIPELQRLEAEYSEYLVVIGVHSAKFDNEGQTDNIKQFIRRYNIEHPVINDVDFIVWDTYGARAWPTQVLIDPNGKIVGGRAGEGVYEAFQPIIATMVEEYGAAGLLNSEPIAKWIPLSDTESALSFPAKVLVDSPSNRLFISDSAHNRIVITSLDEPSNITIIGSGEQGFVDGDFRAAQFNNPQGLAVGGNTLYVADTGNHAIREIDLSNRTVRTLVGTGEQANRYPPLGGTAPNVALSSPWDVTLADGKLFIAMAGPHQIWRVDLITGETVAHAGSGYENIIDGPLNRAQLAQPSGIDNDGNMLYFADAEVSAIRTASIAPDGMVTTIVGTGLFDFGDVDGFGDEVLLQHALGITVADDGFLYIADTYNNKIKRIDPTTRESITLAGTGEAGFADGAFSEAQFYEPNGIDYANGKLYVADTNNHAIRILDLATETVTTLDFGEGVSTLLGTESPLEPVQTPSTDGNQDGIIHLETQKVTAGEGTLVFDIQIPEGYKLNTLAPFTIIAQSDAIVNIEEENQRFREITPSLPVRLPVHFHRGETTFYADVTVYWCEAIQEELCFIERLSFEVPVIVEENASTTELILPHTLIPPIQ